jgi:hypothetical protein
MDDKMLKKGYDKARKGMMKGNNAGKNAMLGKMGKKKGMRPAGKS